MPSGPITCEVTLLPDGKFPAEANTSMLRNSPTPAIKDVSFLPLQGGKKSPSVGVLEGRVAVRFHQWSNVRV